MYDFCIDIKTAIYKCYTHSFVTLKANIGKTTVLYNQQLTKVKKEDQKSKIFS